jgi:SdrD B-like domain/Bacterial Ig domain
MKTRQSARSRLKLDRLEDKVLPTATWPFVPGDQTTNPVVGTWGQYQDLKESFPPPPVPNIWDSLIHFHEGLDIAVKSGQPHEQVRAVAHGWVSQIVRVGDPNNPDDPARFSAGVLIRDNKAPAGSPVWLYLHVYPDSALTKDAEVNPGTLIGTVANLDRPNTGYTNHVHLQRGTGGPEPIPNPLSQFDPALDQGSPRVEGIRFRPAAFDTPGPNLVSEFPPLRREKIQDKTYFQSVAIGGGESATVIGRRANPEGMIVGAGVDIVAKLYDLHGSDFTPPPGTPGRLNPATISFRTLGRATGAGTGPIAGFNFKALTGTVGQTAVSYFGNFFRTRSIYTNDVDQDSELLSPFYYTVTNTRSQSASFGAAGQFPANQDFAKNTRWTTNAKMGQPWNVAPSELTTTTLNARARFPDDLYVVTVDATDLSNNSGSGTELALLDNYLQRITIVPGTVGITGKQYTIQSGAQFQPNYNLRFYTVLNDTGQAKPANGTPLGVDRGGITTNANGGFLNARIQLPTTAGDYWVVADYDGNGVFIDRLDAVARITVRQTRAAAPILPRDDQVSWTRGWALDVAGPGVMANDDVPDPASASVELLAVSPGTSVTLQPDGGYTVARLPAGPDTGWFTYRLTSGGESAEARMDITFTNDAPVGEADQYAVVHGQSLNVPAADGLLGNDGDWDEDPLSMGLIAVATRHGSLTVQPDGSFDYTPAPGFVGTDTFSYFASDGTTQSETPTEVSIEVTNVEPEGIGDIYVARPGQTLTVPASAGIRVNDTDEDGDPISIRHVSISIGGAEHGTLVLASDGSFTYTPDPGYVGYDSFTYQPTDGMAAGYETLVTIHVTNGAVLGDRVWDDQDRDGVQDSGEPGLRDITVRLLDAGGNPVAEQVTNGYGEYLFDAAPGTYRVQIDLPAGASPSPRDVGTDDDADSDIDATGLTGPITLLDGDERYDIDAGLMSDPPASPALGGRVWIDLNANGIRDGGESGLAGITVTLLDAAGLVVATTTTRFDGTYAFEAVAPGQYRVQFTLPPDYTFTDPNQTTDDRDSDVTDFLNGTTDLFNYGGGTKLDLDAGLTGTGT